MISFRSNNTSSPLKKVLKCYQNFLYKLRRRPPVKSDRINALRKQYDSFLEEDRKRKERNDYILGRLDKMRSCDQLVAHGCYRNPVQIKVDPPILLTNTRKDYELQPFRRNYSVEPYQPPPRTVDELDLLRLISKNYILIPKREQRSDDPHEVTPETKTPTRENDWKSKYDILTQLKKDEKESKDDTGKVTELDSHPKNYISDADYLTVGHQNHKLPMNARVSGIAVDPEIPERDPASNIFRNDIEYSRVTKEIVKPAEPIALKVIKDTSNTFDNTYSNNVYDESPIKNFKDIDISEHIRQSQQETLIGASQSMRRPQTYFDNNDESYIPIKETNAVDDKEPIENYLDESEVNPIEISNSVDSVKRIDQSSTDIQPSKEVIHQESPTFADDQVYLTEVVNREDFAPSNEASVHEDAYVHSPSDGNSVQQEYSQEQLQYPPDSEHDTVSEHDTDIALPHQDNEQMVFSQQPNENNQEYDQHGNVVDYSTAQVDETHDYDQSGKAQDVDYEKNIHGENYDQSGQGLEANYEHNETYDQNTIVQDVNYDQHAQVLNLEQTSQDVTYPQNIQDANYDQASQDPVYVENPQENYTDDPTYTHPENYPDQSQVAGDNYDQTYPVDGVYQPDTSYGTDQIFTEGVDQNYANVQNQPVAYDHDITQQQYDQTYAEQYSTQEDQQGQFEQPQQYQQEYDQYQQNEQGSVEIVQQQLDTEDTEIANEIVSQ